MEDENKNWKLKLRSGKLATAFKHFTAITKGVLEEGSSYSPGNAFMAIKIWAATYEETADLVESIAKQLEFTITGKIEIFDTEPQEPPQKEPYGYGINFTYFKG